jgi:hypothetical protein
MDRSDFEVAVLGSVFFYAGVDGSVFRIFLHVVKFLMRDDARGGHGLTDVFGQGYPAILAMKFPGAPVFSGEEVLIPAFWF